MGKRKKSIGLILTLAVSVFSLVFAAVPVLANTVDNTEVVIQKTMYDTGVSETPIINGDGKEITDLPLYGVLPYDKATYGDVGFTMYKVDLAVHNVEDEVALAALADSLNVQNPTLPAGVTMVGSEIIVDADGIARFPNIVGEDNFYIIIESTSPASVVTKSNPLYVQLPVTNDAGDGYLDTIYLYPKNEVQPIELTLTKYFNTAGVNSLGEGASFSLYQGTPGSGSVVSGMDNLIANAEGQITVKDLTLGSYYFIENPVAGLTEQGSVVSDDLHLVSPYARDTAANRLSFTINPDGTITQPEGSLIGGLVNYDKPAVTKTVDTVNDTVGYGPGNAMTYTVSVALPDNLEDYATLVLEDSPRVEYEDGTVFEKIVPSADPAISTNAVIKAGSNAVPNDLFTFSETDGSPGGVTITLTDGVTQEFLDAVGDARTLSIEYKMYLDYIAPAGSITSDDLYQKLVMRNTVVQTLTTISGDTIVDGDVVEKDILAFNVWKSNSGAFGIGSGGESLPGAEFVLSRWSDETETVREYLNIDSGVYSWVEDVEDAYVFVTDDDGMFTVIGIPEGEYELIETKAPVGYRLPLDPITQVLVDDSTQGLGPRSWAANIVEITNDGITQFVPTGSQVVFLVGGIVMLLGAGAAAIFLKKKKEQNGSEE